MISQDLTKNQIPPPSRSAPFDQEPGFYVPASLWLYGNVRLLGGQLASVALARFRSDHRPKELDAVEREAEELVLGSAILVCGIHSPGHQRAAIVPLRWGSPRVLVLSGGFYHHLGSKLDQEPFRAARLWRYQFDPKTDLCISRRAPDKLPTYALLNPSVDRLIERIVGYGLPGELFNTNSEDGPPAVNDLRIAS